MSSFPRLITNATVTLHDEGEGRFTVYLEAEHPQSGEPLLLQLNGRATPIGGDQLKEVNAKLERASQSIGVK